MSLYTRRQLVVLLILLVLAGLGLAIGHWRRARPDAVDYLEGLDRTPGSSLSAPRTGDGAPAPASSEPEPPRSRQRKELRESERPPSGAADAPSEPIDLNRATTVELSRLPGIGQALARRIVDTRAAEGPFARVDELGRVRGITARKLERLRAFVTVAR